MQKVRLVLVMLGAAVMGAALADATSPRARAETLVETAMEQSAGPGEALQNLLVDVTEQTSFCSRCHGQDGHAVRPDIPNLAAQQPVYLLRRLLQYQARTEQSRVMHGMVRKQTDQDLLAMALYYAGLPPRAVSFDPGQAQTGAPLFQTLCVHCHGEDGMGNATYPRLKGQQTEYTAEVLRKFRQGERKSKPMHTAIRGFTDAEIDALAAYAASLGSS